MKFHFSIIGHGEAASEVEFVEWLQDMMNEYNSPIPKFTGKDKVYDESAYYFLNSYRIPKSMAEAEPHNQTKFHHIRVTKGRVREYNKHLDDTTPSIQFSRTVKAAPKLNFYHVLVREDVIQD